MSRTNRTHPAIRTQRARVALTALALCAGSSVAGLTLVACSDSTPVASTRGRGTPPRPGAAAGAPAAAGSGARPAAGAAATPVDANRPPPLALTEADFTESDRTRDPFRSFAHEFVPQGPVVQVDEHAIKLREYALESLQLVAVILGTDSPYAMVIDSTGRGTIIRRGEYVGRPETVSGGDGLMPHQVPWRVARIVGSRVSRDENNNLTEVPGEVVFEREDRLNPTGGRAERVLSLSANGQANRAAEPTAAAPAVPTIPGFGPGGTPFLPSAAVNPAAAANAAAAGRPTGPMPPGGATFVQSYTTVVPPQAAQPAAPTTVLIQTGPQGQTTVSNGTTATTGGPGANNPPAAPTGPRDPYGAPGGPNAGGVPPIQVTGGGSIGAAPMPISGLPR